MNCPECRFPIPDTHIAGCCPACTERKSQAALLERAKEYLPNVISGQTYLKLRRAAAARGGWHIELSNSGHNRRTFCGLAVEPRWHRLTRYWDEIQQLAICGSCSDCLARLAREINEHASA
jgi:hypothetical protein